MEKIKELLDYDPETGEFHWRQRRGYTAQPGKLAGHLDTYGHVQITVDWKIYAAHRLAWLMFYGTFPKKTIDHIDGNKANNRIENLRDCSHAENCKNQRKRLNNKSGYKGVVLAPSGKWIANIRFGGKQHYLGTFSTPEQAHAAYCQAADAEHKEFAHHG